MEYKITIPPKMTELERVLRESFVGMSHCISVLGRNLVVEVPKDMCDSVVSTLKDHFEDVVLIKKAHAMIDDLHDFILVKALISEAPVFIECGVAVPYLEKTLVDLSSDKEFASMPEAQIQAAFQRAAEIYGINRSRLLRYAGRKGKKEEISGRLGKIDKSRVETVRSIQDYLRKTPVQKAWLFGSFSRMEERDDSDVDILVSLDKDAHMGLLAYSEIISGLENLTRRRIDLVVEGTLKPFAVDNVERDKVLIYERDLQR